MDPQAKRCLDVWIGQDKKIMTYRSLSRELGIPTDQAESVLSEYFQSHQSLHPTYLVSGTFVTKHDKSEAMDVDGSQSHINGGQNEESQVSRAGMIVCKPEEVEAKKKLFDSSTASVKLYSLSPSETRDPSSLVLPFMTLLSHKAYVDPSLYGTATYQPVTNGASKSKSALTGAAPSRSNAPAPATSTAKTTAKPGAKPKLSESGTLGFSKAEPKSIDPANIATHPSKPISKPMVSIFSSDDENEAPVQKSKPRAKALSSSPPSPPITKGSSTKGVNQTKVAAQKKELEGLWDMDVDGSEEPSSGRIQKGKKRDLSLEEESDAEEGSKPATKRAAAKAPAKAPAKPRTSADKKVAAVSVKQEEDASEKMEGVEGKKVRKVRRTIKTVTSTNKRGYEVTEDVSTDESYYSDESTDSKPKTQATAKAGTSVASKGRASTKVARADSEDDEGSNENEGKSRPPQAKKPKPSVPAAAADTVKKPVTMATVGAKGKPPLKGQTSLAGFFSKK